MHNVIQFLFLQNKYGDYIYAGFIGKLVYLIKADENLTTITDINDTRLRSCNLEI